jgi:hypothetical protein
LRGAATHDEPGIRDPLLRAIAELRDQLDRLIDEQQAALEGFVSGLVGETSSTVDRPAFAAEEPSIAVTSKYQEPASRSFEENRVPPLRVSDPAPRARRPAAFEVPESIDGPSAGPPGPPATTPFEPAAGARSDDPRERLDALAKHLDRKLRRAGGPPAGPPSS